MNKGLLDPNRETGEYTITLSGSDLFRLRELSKKLNVSECDLDILFKKGLAALSLPDDGKLVFLKYGGCCFVNVRDL